MRMLLKFLIFWGIIGAAFYFMGKLLGFLVMGFMFGVLIGMAVQKDQIDNLLK